MFRKIRILILLLILLFVALSTWRSDNRLASWKHVVRIAVYPIAADDSPVTAQFIRELEPASFAVIESWLQAEVKRYRQTQQPPAQIRLGAEIKTLPPSLPDAPNTLEIMLWSLKLRWWAYRQDDEKNIKPHIQLFVLFHDAKRHVDMSLPHSIGMRKGKIGVIHVFASAQQVGQNAVIIAHELLHTFGATDKYDFATLQPIYPQGYAEPERSPLLPQTLAEIMGGRIPLSQERAEIPGNLSVTRIGRMTAEEIGLLTPSP
ncbi:MAG: hypothetical protein LBF51_05460 [Zoogloeaceae bacterium]|jgi:hypothetical protein|nr:hypothetical protein [Zoogloeaceae bacterium]